MKTNLLRKFRKDRTYKFIKDRAGSRIMVFNHKHKSTWEASNINDFITTMIRIYIGTYTNWRYDIRKNKIANLNEYKSLLKKYS